MIKRVNSSTVVIYHFYSRLVSCSMIVAIAAAAAAAVVNSDMGQRNGGKVVDMEEMPIKGVRHD